MDAGGFSFEREWPETAVRLKTALRRRRIPAPLIDDLVQDTGLRLFQRWDYVDPERGAWPLAYTVAMNILKDQIRAEERRKSVVPAPPAPPDFDPELMALARIELERVRDALVQLSPGQRSALLAELGECAQDDRSSSAVKMLRLRARKRLKALTHEAPGVFGTIELLAQRFIERAGSFSLPGGAALTAPIAAGLLSLGMITGPSGVHALGGLPSDPSQATAVPALSEDVARQVANVLDGATGRERPGSTEDLVTAIRLSDDGTDYGTSSSRSAGKRSKDGKAGAGGPGGPDGAQDPVGVPNIDDTLPPTDGSDAPPVTVEDGEANAGPDGAGGSAGGSGGGHEVSAEVHITPGGSGDSGGLPSVGGEVEVDGKKVLELG